MDRGSYWAELRDRLVTRRRVLVGGAAAGLGLTAASVIGCGGGNDEEKPEGEFGFDKPIDTTKSATAGGIFKGFTTRDVTSWDPLEGSSFTAQASIGAWAYSRLISFKAGVNQPADGNVESDLATDWEIAQDGLQVTFKLRQDAKWDQRAPTNSRPVDSSDVAFTWKKFEAKSTFRQDLAYSVNKSAPVLSVTTPDKYTAVFKLGFPYSAFVPLMASSSHFYVMPSEADEGYNPANDARGSGAWIISRYQPSALFEYRRNPNWYRKDRPFFDGFDYPIVPEYAQQTAQFKADNIWFDPTRQEDVLQMKRDKPELLIRQGEAFAVSQVGYIFFGYNPDSPFRDERLRQAASMATDRDLYVDTFGNVSAFRRAGLDIKTAWNTHVQAGWGPFWLNPQDEKAFGANAKYFKYDPAEAKKLLTAAGYPNGLDTDAYYIPTGQYGSDFQQRAEAWLGMLDAAGIRTRRHTVDYQTVWLPKFSQSQGAFTGFGIGARNVFADIGPTVGQNFHAGSRLLTPEPDPEVAKMIDAQYKEFDQQKRIRIWHDIQRYLAKTMYGIGPPGSALGLGLARPFIGNSGVFQRWTPSSYSSPQEVYIHLWLDKSKMKTA